jgi:hypothetical protein
MFSLPLTARRPASIKQQRSSGRPQLEGLENRLVLTYPFLTGTILFTNYHSSYDTNSTNPPQPGIIGIEHPGTSEQQTPEAVKGSLAAGSTNFQKPSNLFEDPTDPSVVYVTDDGVFLGGSGPLILGATGAVLKVQFSATSNPLVTVVSKGGFLYDPTAVVALVDGNGKEWLYVTDTGNVQGNTRQGYVVKIDPSTGGQTKYFGTVGYFGCPVGAAPVYSAGGGLDSTHLWVADQGGNAQRGYGPGELWKVDLSNTSSAPVPWSLGYYLDIHTSMINPPLNYALGNLQDIAVDPSSGNVYFPQYGDEVKAGSVVKVIPPANPPQNLTSDQVKIAQDDGSINGQQNAVIGWRVAGDAWDPNYNNLGPRVIVDASEAKMNSGGAPRYGHLEAVDPATGALSEVTQNDAPGTFPPQNYAYIATATGMITYVSGLSRAAALPSPGDGRANLAALDFSFPDPVDAPSLASSPGGTGPVSSRAGMGNLEQANGFPALADRPVLVPQTDPFWENAQEIQVWHLSLQDGLQRKANQQAVQAEAFFTVPLASGQEEGLVSKPGALGSI